MDSIGQEGVEVDYGDDPADVHQVGWRPCRGDSSPGLACPAGPPPAGSLPLPTPALPPSQNGHEDAEEEDQAGADEGAEEGVAGEGGAAAEEAGMEQQQPGEQQQQQGGQQQQQAQAPQQPAAAAKPPPPQRPPGGADSGVREEWHSMDIPESWRPIPMIRVRAGRAGALLCLPACERTASRRSGSPAGARAHGALRLAPALYTPHRPPRPAPPVRADLGPAQGGHGAGGDGCAGGGGGQRAQRGV